MKATEDGQSAITGTNLNIYGSGSLTAVAKGTHAYGIGGANTESIKITGVHIVEAMGGHAYGIGSDTKYYKDAPEGGAAIGSGKDGAVITLDKVTVMKAIGGSKTAAIGANFHTGVTINITDSVIDYAEGGVSAAGIGGSRVSNGANESGTTINITNSNVTAQGGAYGAGIGSGYDTHCQSIQPLCTINISDSTIKATGGDYAAGVGTGYHNAALKGEIKNSSVIAASGEKVYKATYTTAMDVGFGVIDLTREGKQSDSYLILNGSKIQAPNMVASEVFVDMNALAGQSGEIKVNADYSTSDADGHFNGNREYAVKGEGTELTFDLNGHNITHDGTYQDGKNTGYTYLFTTAYNAKLTVKGEGSITSENKEGNSCIFYAQGPSEIIIESGNYHAVRGIPVWAGKNAKVIINGGSFTSSGSSNEEMIYSSGGVIEIHGGFFHNQGWEERPVNVADANLSTGYIYIYGGTFVNFDPSTGGNDPSNILVMDGYKVVSEMQENGDIWYTVVPVSSGN